MTVLGLAAALLVPSAAVPAVPPAPKAVTAFQSANMPDGDRKTLSPEFLNDNAARAYAAWKNAPWAAQVPRDVFLNDILPYASLTEPREEWRTKLAAVAAPLVAGCRTSGEAAVALNKGLFPALKVRYSTARSRADQSPAETIGSGLASCSGLSILLVDACRSVGVPARVVGTPLWADGRGNHTWVEVWDAGGWHYLGAAEPDDKGLDHAWFAGDAARAVKSSPEHAIYASSFRRTGLSFPLVWAPNVSWVSAENVTDRYALPAAASEDPDHVSVHIRVVDAKGRRVAMPVTVRDLDDPAGTQSGVSTGDTADHNNLFTLSLPRGRAYEIIAGKARRQTRQTFAAGTEAADTVTLALPPVPRPAPPLTLSSAKALNTALAAYFAAPAAKQATWKFAPPLDALLLQNEDAVRQAAWEAYKAAPIHQAAQEDMAANQVRSGDYLSPYIVKTVGTRPPGGWGLVIAMHGGGGAPKALNDSQWHGMATYYNDHPEAGGGYKYLALRAPNDTWNGFYDDYVYPLVTRLINEYLVLGDVNPDKIYLIGYSHGGYGAFAIGPKMPDRFAAIHASGAAGTDGESAVENLRDVPFSVWVGEHDTMYGRLDRTKALAAKLTEMRGGHADTYPMSVDVKAGYQHGNLPDRDRLAVLLPAVRSPVPSVVTWLMTDTVIRDFYWLHSDAPTKTQRLEASIKNNAVVVTASPNVTGTSVMLDSRLVDFLRPVTLSVNGRQTTQRIAPHLKTLAETLARRGDPRLAFTAVLPLTTTP